MTWAQSMRQRMEDWLATLPDPAYIRVPAARKTIPFSRGRHEFKVVWASAQKPVIEYLDQDEGLLATQVLKEPAGRKDTISLVVAEGPFWRADMR